MIKNEKLYETKKFNNLKELVDETVKLYSKNIIGLQDDQE